MTFYLILRCILHLDKFGETFCYLLVGISADQNWICYLMLPLQNMLSPLCNAACFRHLLARLVAWHKFKIPLIECKPLQRANIPHCSGVTAIKENFSLLLRFELNWQIVIIFFISDNFSRDDTNTYKKRALFQIDYCGFPIDCLLYSYWYSKIVTTPKKI